MGEMIDFGINVGMVNGAVAVWDGDQASVLKNNDGQDYMPAVVYLDKNGRLLVGRTARQRMDLDPDNACVEFKYALGTPTDFRFGRGRRAYRADELTGEVIKAIRLDAEQHLSRPVNAAVIAVPPSFSQVQCDAVCRAAQQGGLQSCLLVMEPIAAAMAHAFYEGSDQAYWLVFALGPTAFNATLLQVEGGTFRLVNQAGDQTLGSRVIDWEIIDRLLAPTAEHDFALNNFNRLNPKWRKAFSKLKAEVEQAKHRMSRATSFNMVIDYLCNDEKGEPVPFEYELRREDVIRLATPHIQRTVEICKTLLSQASVRPSAVSKIILVTEPGEMPLPNFVTEFLESTRTGLGHKLDDSLDPAKVVALGAAIFAGTQTIEAAVPLAPQMVGKPVSRAPEPAPEPISPQEPEPRVSKDVTQVEPARTSGEQSPLPELLPVPPDSTQSEETSTIPYLKPVPSGEEAQTIQRPPVFEEVPAAPVPLPVPEEQPFIKQSVPALAEISPTVPEPVQQNQGAVISEPPALQEFGMPPEISEEMPEEDIALVARSQRVAPVAPVVPEPQPLPSPPVYIPPERRPRPKPAPPAFKPVTPASSSQPQPALPPQPEHLERLEPGFLNLAKWSDPSAVAAQKVAALTGRLEAMKQRLKALRLKADQDKEGVGRTLLAEKIDRPGLIAVVEGCLAQAGQDAQAFSGVVAALVDLGLVLESVALALEGRGSPAAEGKASAARDQQLERLYRMVAEDEERNSTMQAQLQANPYEGYRQQLDQLAVQLRTTIEARDAARANVLMAELEGLENKIKMEYPAYWVEVYQKLENDPDVPEESKKLGRTAIQTWNLLQLREAVNGMTSSKIK